jgi:putative intracellular protease/amidase
MARISVYLAALGLAAAASAGCGRATAQSQWMSLLDYVSPATDAVAGTWRKDGDALTVNAATGARIAFPVTPITGEYDLRATFTRRTGRNSVGLVLTQGGKQVVFEVDAWGQHLGGFQNLAGRNIQQNPTRKENVALQNGRRYTLLAEVRKGSLRGLLDGQEIAGYKTDGRDLSVPDLWRMPDSSTLGLVAWESETTFHSVELRPLGSAPAIARQVKLPTRPATPPQPARTSSPSQPAGTTTHVATGKRVLQIIANRDFFYREYAEPRAAFDAAGLKVTVAAGRRGLCTPHGGSGQGPDGGNVNAEIALSEVRTQDYDAVLFSGGWGASAYQFAFNGRYNDPSYNGERAIKAQANRIINEMIAQDKYVAALCNGVSVLAWARVNGRSPLQGKRVCAPVRQAAAGIYNGRPAQPSCRWHPEVNGAIMSPPGVIGQPGTAADDVMVDGKILTGEDDISAREMGRRLVQLLSR